MQEPRITVIGAGAIGGALLTGLVAAGYHRETLSVVGRGSGKATALAERLRIRRADTVASDSEVVVVAVKPQDVDGALAPLRDVLRPGALLLSLCAGVPTARLEAALPAGTAVVRAMPNTPMLVGEAISAVSPGRHATAAHRRTATELLSAVGRVVELPEHQQDAVTALSGSGPAYFFYLVETMIDAGVLLGLSRSTAAELAVQSAQGAATMLRQTDDHVTTLREAVTSPAGTTAAALRELERHKVRAAMIDAVSAAAGRSAEPAAATR